MSEAQGDAGVGFEKVFTDEQTYIRRRWQNVYGSAREREPTPDVEGPALGRGLVGLAFSGGGIRSATINLGIAQALHRRGVFRHADYMSTVSGGGYLGSSISTIMRDGDPFPYHDGGNGGGGPQTPLRRWLKRFGKEQPETPFLIWLRNNSNYLATGGMLDYVRLIAVLVRGILINLLTLVPGLLLFSLYLYWRHGERLRSWKASVEGPSPLAPHQQVAPQAPDFMELFRVTPLLIGLFALLVLLFPVFIRVYKVYRHRRAGDEAAAAGPGEESSVGSRGLLEMVFAVSLVAIAAAAVIEALPILLHYFHQFRTAGGLRQVFAGAASGTALAMLAGAGQLLGKLGSLRSKLLMAAIGLLGLILPLLGVLYVTEGLVYNWLAAFRPPAGSPQGGASWSLFALLLGLVGAEGAATLVGFFWRVETRKERLVRLAAGIGAAAAGFALVWGFVWTVGLPALALTVGGVAAGAAATAAGRLLARLTGRRSTTGVWRWAGAVVGLAAFVLAWRWFAGGWPELSHAAMARMSAAPVEPWQSVLAMAAVIFLYCWAAVNVNLTSGHGMYRDRLANAYLVGLGVGPAGSGAPPRRRPTDGAGLEEDSDNWQVFVEPDLSLQKICQDDSVAPYHLVNTTINLQGSNDPMLRDRNSDFFIFSKQYCGGERTGYCTTEELESVFPQLDLPTAMAISAAAASPNAGRLTSKPLVALMTLLNVRLGYWVPHPRALRTWLGEVRQRLRKKGGKKRQIGSLPDRWHWRIRPLALVREMFSQVSEKGKWVNLSDGGHIENLAVYELLRRRCKYIICGDGEADKNLTFGGLAALMRYARIDLGVEIDVILDDIRLSDDGRSHQHCALGKIWYPKQDASGFEREHGYLLYIKSSFTGDEDETMQEYRANNPDFPHETTADQFFDEGQFEAYRALGFHMADGLFPLEDLHGELDSYESWPAFENWFQRLRTNLAPRLSAKHTALQEQLRRIQRLLRRREHEAYLYELDPEAMDADAMPDTVDPQTGSKRRKARPAETLYLVEQQLGLMESAFLSLDLDQRRNWDHEGNDGWRKLFERWAASPTFRWGYARNISLHSGRFRNFCASVLGLETAAKGAKEAGSAEPA